MTVLAVLTAPGCEKNDLGKPPYRQEDIACSDDIVSYLRGSYDCKVNSVTVSDDKVAVSVSCAGTGEFMIGEYTPYANVFQTVTPYMYSIADGESEIVLDRFVRREGFDYDRLLSKWAVFGISGGRSSLASHARYADEIHAVRNLE